MKKVCVIGHFGGDKTFFDGQTIKTKIITKELKKQLGDSQVSIIDTYGGKKVLIKCLFKCFKALKRHNNIIMLPAHNGVKFFTPVLLFFNVFFNRRLHYSVIGGWLPDFLNKHKFLKLMLKKFDFIYVETDSMKQKLCAMGFSNIAVVVNCKELNILNPEKLIYNDLPPYKLCTFSRVMKEKGIDDAINAVKSVNEKMGKTVYELHIYGQVDNSQTQWFDDLKANFPEYVSYKGIVKFDESTSVLKDYFALLFPTYYEGEGFAGTIIDSMSAGVPIIASDWRYNKDIVTKEIGYIFKTQCVNELAEILLNISKDVNLLNSKKTNCLMESYKYLPERALTIMVNNLI